MRHNERFLGGLQPRTRRGVSLSEVLVVCAIILFLLALLVPGLQHAKEQARRVQCANNLRQWGVALQCYRDDHGDYLPTEGTYLQPEKPYTWFNVLPPYLNAPAYHEVERTGKAIKDFSALHVWICPSKNLSRLYKSDSGKNQFHYGMNAVLDGMNSSLTPDFGDQGELPIRGTLFAKKPNTVFMFDIHANQSLAHPLGVATEFHRDLANVLYLNGMVANFHSNDFVTNGDYRNGEVIWDHPHLYWGYPPPGRSFASKGQ